jgi:subtilisin family serine protease
VVAIPRSRVSQSRATTDIDGGGDPVLAVMRLLLRHPARALVLVSLAALLTTPSAVAGTGSAQTREWPRGTVVVRTYAPRALRATLRRLGAHVVRSIPALGVVEVRPARSARRLAATLSSVSSVDSVAPAVERYAQAEPALLPYAVPGGAYEWQYAAVREDAVPAAVVNAASAITIAVVDTGGDVSAPDLAAKSPATHSVLSGSSVVTDTNGHGTFVSSLAAGSVSNGEGIAGFGGNAQLMIVQAGQPDGVFTDVDEAAGIVYAVDHGAKIVNLSLGGPQSSQTEISALSYAASHGVLVVVAAGNAFMSGDPVEYPAALVQPVGSNGQGGTGLAVGASTLIGTRAAFSNTGSYLSLAAPGENVFGAIAATADPAEYASTALPRSSAGTYGYGSGTSFATPEVAGAAALVWAANPLLTYADVAGILKESASGHGAWNPELGYGVIDVAAAVARAQGVSAAARTVTLAGVKTGRTVHLTWWSPGAVSFRLSVSRDGAAERLLLGSTTDIRFDFDLERGHTYAFRLAALDAFGVAALSAPYDVSLVQKHPKLTLSASPRRGGHPLRTRLTARLTTGDATVTAAGRTVVFESFDGGFWHPFGHARTAASGSASLAAKLARGIYRIRARFAGSPALTAATSPVLTLRAR